MAGCVIVAPLDDVRPSVDAIPTPPDACRKDGCLDGAPPDPGRSPSTPTQDADGGPDAVTTRTEGAPAGGCLPPPGAVCDPLAACGCPTGSRCDLDDSQRYAGIKPSLACLPPKSGGSALYDPCHLTTECAPGLFCSTTHLCLPYCLGDSDCESRECLFYLNDQGTTVPGSGGCQRACDPSVSDSCGPAAECYPANDGTVWNSAICQRRPDGEPANRPEGAPCESRDDCAHDLDCARSNTDRDQWRPLLAWLEGGRLGTAADAGDARRALG